MATVDHMSNANLCDENRGLTSVGLRLNSPGAWAFRLDRTGMLPRSCGYSCGHNRKETQQNPLVCWLARLIMAEREGLEPGANNTTTALETLL